MNWTFVLLAFALAVLMGAAFTTLLAQLRPEWSPKRRMVIGASALPLITVIATMLGIGFVTGSSHDAGETMEDLAVRAILTIGGGFALLAFLGGLVGGAFAQRRRG